MMITVMGMAVEVVVMVMAMVSFLLMMVSQDDSSDNSEYVDGGSNGEVVGCGSSGKVSLLVIVVMIMVNGLLVVVWVMVTVRCGQLW